MLSYTHEVIEEYLSYLMTSEKKANEEYTYGEYLTPQIEEIIKPNDAILVKASQGMRFEKIVKDIMAEPLRAKELLVRQDNSWLRK